MSKFSIDEEYKSEQLKEKTLEELNKVLKEEAKEGWSIRAPKGYGLRGIIMSQEYAVEYGFISLIRFKDWKARKEEKKRIEKEAAESMPPLENKIAAELRGRLSKIENRIKSLERKKREVQDELAIMARQCVHDWKITKTEASFVFTEQTCKKCGEKTLGIFE